MHSQEPRSTDVSDAPAAVLCSGGLDSAILVGEWSQTLPRVVPIYLRFGLVWEEAEEQGLRRYLAALDRPTVDPLVVFEMPLRSVYGEHWSTTARETPDASTPDEAVFLPGRNLLLVLQPAIWCHLNGISRLALAPLASNPFPDSTPEFFSELEGVIRRGLGGCPTIERPYAGLHKCDVMQRGADFPLGETFSCIHPEKQLHCGRCNKCAERRRAFADAGLSDPTRYAVGR
jgi:7-cyano-7-deazaguanine synthase